MSEPQQPSDNDQDDFDKAFDAHATSIAGPAPAVPKLEESDDDDAPNGGEPQKPEPGQAQASDDDPLKDAPENVRKLFTDQQQALSAEKAARLAAEHSARSNAGRVSALQKKLDDAGKRTPPSNNAGGSDTPGGANGNDDGDSFGQEYPEVSDFVERRAKKLEESIEQKLQPVISRIEQEEAEVQQRAEEARIAAAFQTVATAHPDFDQIRSDQAYGQWLTKQGPTVRKLAESEDPADAISLIDLYKAQSRPADSQRNSRQKLVEAAEEIPSKGGSRRTGVPDDFDAAFEIHANSIQSKAKR